MVSFHRGDNFLEYPLREPSIAKLRFGQLRLLAAMEKTGSIRRAAAEVSMTQPAVSKALKELEAILGARLYERSSQGVIATAAGQIAARGAKLLLAELGMLTQEIRQAESGESLSARIGITPYLGGSLLPEALARLSRTVHLGRVHLEEGWAGPLLDKLAEGALDLLIIMCTPEMVPALHNPSLKYERLFDEQLAVVAAPGHRLARRRRVNLGDLAEEAWILGVHPSLTRRSLEDAFLHHGLRPPRPVVEATFLTNLLEAAASGLGIAACPLKGVERAFESGRVVRLALKPVIALPPIVIVYRRLLSEHPRLAALGEALRVEFTSARPRRNARYARPT
jgi:molybdate transport repressor ModE-like protein